MTDHDGPSDGPSELVTIKEAARLLSVHVNTIRQRIRRGDYTTAHLDARGRYVIEREDLDAHEVHRASVKRDDPGAESTRGIALVLLRRWEEMQERYDAAQATARQYAAQASKAEGQNEWLRGEIDRTREEMAALRAEAEQARADLERTRAVLSKRQRRRLEDRT